MPILTTPTKRSFSVAVACDDEHWQLRLSGPVDLASGADLLDMADIMATFRVADTDIDLSDVSFINTAGLQAVEEVCQRIERNGGSARTSHDSEAVSFLRSQDTTWRNDNDIPTGAVGWPTHGR